MLEGLIDDLRDALAGVTIKYREKEAELSKERYPYFTVVSSEGSLNSSPFHGCQCFSGPKRQLHW